ncbi:MAG: NAD(P)H-dependent oxidoreductase subunit E, partial [Hyphomicrobium sp.]
MTKSTLEVVIEAPLGSEELARTICAAHDNQPDELLEIFHELQHELGYVPEQVLTVIGEALNRSRAEIYGVLSFYHEFRRTPGGRHTIKICRAEACQAM